MRRIGVLMGYSENDPEAQTRLAAFKQTLMALGWSEGRNLRIDVRWAASGDKDRASTFAKELMTLRPEVILSNTTPATAALHQETRAIPIVFVSVSDPIGSGFVASVARPGGNITGFTILHASIAGKYLAMLKELVPQLRSPDVQFEFRTGFGHIFFPAVHRIRGEIQGTGDHRASARPRRD